MDKQKINKEAVSESELYTVLAVVNYNAVDSWLEPYIGMRLNIIKRGIKVTWFEMDYGKKVKRKFDSSCFNYC